MALESLLGPLKWVDKQVLRQHTKIAKCVEDRNGMSKADLADVLSCGVLLIEGIYAAGYITTSPHEANAIGTAAPIVAASVYLSKAAGTILNSVAIFVRNDDYERSSDTMAVNPVTPGIRKVFRTLRLPLFVAGLSGVGHSFYEPFAAANFSTDYLADYLGFLTDASFTILGASALYMKDTDPKLLDKEPFWKSAYHWAKEKMSSVVPEPALQPVPVKSYFSL